MHVILATQRPAATIVGGLVKANLPVRLVGAVASPEDAKVATGVAGSGANRLRGRGDFLLVARQTIVRFQAAYISDRDIPQLIELETQRWRYGDFHGPQSKPLPAERASRPHPLRRQT